MSSRSSFGVWRTWGMLEYCLWQRSESSPDPAATAAFDLVQLIAISRDLSAPS
jgi:hypothetical protein